MEEQWFCYIATCSDGTLYTGVAKNNVSHRIDKHMLGYCKYTRGRLPIGKYTYVLCRDKSAALRCEAFIKKHMRKDKLEFFERKGRLWEKTAQFRM